MIMMTNDDEHVMLLPPIYGPVGYSTTENGTVTVTLLQQLFVQGCLLVWPPKAFCWNACNLVMDANV